MIEEFREINPEQISDNVFKLIGSDWMLITSGNKIEYNCMTASWGGLGVLWDEDVSFCFIRPTRYTYSFMEKNDQYTISFFDESYREALDFCGSYSGRNVKNKGVAAGLTPMEENGVVFFKEARLVIFCKKIYYQDIIPSNFLEDKIAHHYPKSDYHRMYIGKILKCIYKC